MDIISGNRVVKVTILRQIKAFQILETTRAAWRHVMFFFGHSGLQVSVNDYGDYKISAGTPLTSVLSHKWMKVGF